MVLKKHNYLAVNLSATSKDNSEHTYTCGMTRDGEVEKAETNQCPPSALCPYATPLLRSQAVVVMASIVLLRI